MTGRVAWSEYSGEDIERAVAMFIAMEHPRAVRITPSRGDGGVDILDRGARTVVYQVKGFHGALTTGQQRQVEDSIDRLTSDPRWADLSLDEWHLVTPWDPTPERLKWLVDYAQSKGLPEPIWDGLADCDGWAAKYPYIVDYFFDGGRRKVQEAAAQLLEGFRLKELTHGIPDDLSVDDVRQGMSSAVAFLNERDVYYKYGLSVGPASPGVGGFLPQTSQANLVTSVHQADKNVAVRIDIFAKTALSIQERPITVDLRMRAAPGSTEEQSIKDFLKYGSPLDLPLGTVEADFDGPDVMQQPMVEGALRLHPASGSEDGEPQLRLVLFDQAGEQLTSLLVDREYTTHGQSKDGFVQGLEAAFTDVSGCLSLLIRFDLEHQSTSMNFEISRPDGVLATDAFPALWAFRCLRREGNTFVLAPRFGPVVGDHMPAQGADEADAVRLWFDIAKSLTLLQEHTHVRLYFPEDLSNVSEGWIRSVCFHGALLNGQVLQIPVEEAYISHGEDSPEPDEAGVVKTAVPWTFMLDETQIDLGFLVHEFKGAFKETVEHDEHGSLDVWTITEGGLRVRRPSPDETVVGL